MTGKRSRAPSQWALADELASSLAALQTTQTNSKTIQLDESNPPTPDDTGRPDNFQMIAPGLYRSSYPHSVHFTQLEGLNLRTIVTLVAQDPPMEYAHFLSSNAIAHHHIPILANKDEDVYTDADTINKVLSIMLEPRNYPMLVHCNKGRHRTGCVTACFRKVTGWTTDACLEEYERYSSPKSRALDKAFIERYDASILKPVALERGFVGGVYRQPVGESTKSSIYTTNTVETTTTSDSLDCPISGEYQRRPF
ncbi:hypothetical protein DV736_g489, partial [Chaetothyriales sp. CBS 134916]